ncbi:MAG: M28 family metallopeptidase, partial [Kofleriaceae bacterium]
MNARVVVALVLLGAGCDGGRAAPDASQPPVDVAALPDAPPDPPDAPDASSCLSPDECDLEAFQREIVAKLSGAMDITPGVRLLHRASAAERTTTREFLLDELTALGFAPELQTYATGANVVARLDATTGSGELIVVGAHFDSVSAVPGAADNATGVAIVLAVARRVRDLPVREHPIAFALFDEEESGLIGSRAYAAALASSGTTVAAAHVFDMLSFDGD